MPNGCYVIGEGAENGLEEYGQDSSALTANFLLTRIETGGNANYPHYQASEARLERSDILQMSKLTRALLDNIDYVGIREKGRRTMTTRQRYSRRSTAFPKSCSRGRLNRFRWYIRC